MKKNFLEKRKNTLLVFTDWICVRALLEHLVGCLQLCLRFTSCLHRAWRPAWDESPDSSQAFSEYVSHSKPAHGFLKNQAHTEPSKSSVPTHVSFPASPLTGFLFYYLSQVLSLAPGCCGRYLTLLLNTFSESHREVTPALGMPWVKK